MNPVVEAYRVDEKTGEVIYLQNLVMEGMLGRKMRSDEKVRFKNGNHLDCREQNLQLVKRRTK